jgi:pyruvate dehydrogenase E2 component (dihydrolipoamide acetyltransferase)
MQSEIVMPQLGLTMAEGSVNAWLKQPGERVEKGEMLFTVSTDKVDMEVESTASGFLSPLVELNTMVSVGTVIAVLTDQQGQANASERIASNGQRSARPQPAAESTSYESTTSTAAEMTPRGGIPGSPRARSLAKRRRQSCRCNSRVRNSHR